MFFRISLVFYNRRFFFFPGSAFAVRAQVGATVGRVDRQVPIRLSRRTSDDARPGDHSPVRIRGAGRPAPGVGHAPDAVAQAHGPRQVRDIPAANWHRHHRQRRRCLVAGEFNYCI